MGMRELLNVIETGDQESVRVIYAKVSSLREKLGGFDTDGEQLFSELKAQYFKLCGIK